jgi:hypothetical protein
MTHRPPSFDDLFDDDDLAPEERERLEAVHELLSQAGPPPELPPALESPPAVGQARVIPLPRRYRFTAVAAALAAAVALFGFGYLIGGSGSGTPTVLRTVEMTGEGGAVASLAVLAKDEAGNWPMELTVSGLEPLPRGQSYELWLTRNGELAESCGSFAVSGPETVVTLNAPYRLSDFTGWVVTTAADTGAFVLTTEQT